jgi:hypothetical protein
MSQSPQEKRKKSKKDDETKNNKTKDGAISALYCALD